MKKFHDFCSICPSWLCFSFDNPIRKLIHKPNEILKEYLKNGDKVIDLGPGMGYLTFPIGQIIGKNGIVYAADIQNEMLLHIEKK